MIFYACARSSNSPLIYQIPGEGCVCVGGGGVHGIRGLENLGDRVEIEYFNRLSQVKSSVTQAVRLFKGAVLRSSDVNKTDLLETRYAFVSYPVTAPRPVTAAPSNSSSLALGLGLGLGLLAFGSVVAIMVMRRRAAAQRAIFAVGSNMQLHEGLLVASAE